MGAAAEPTPSVQQLLSMQASLFPLSSRAKPRDLRFYGPVMEMFFVPYLALPRCQIGRNATATVALEWAASWAAGSAVPVESVGAAEA
jgi:hypothetical protein